MYYRIADYDLNKSPNRKETKCIDSAEDLLQAYINKEHHNMVAGNQTIFKISQEVILRYAQIAIYYRTLPPLPQDNVTTTISNDACCDPITEEDCQVLITSRKSIYVYFPPHLVYTMVKVISVSNMYWDSKMNYGLVKGCWTPPTFCDDTNTVTILRDFSIKVRYSVHMHTHTVQVASPPLISGCLSQEGIMRIPN